MQHARALQGRAIGKNAARPLAATPQWALAFILGTWLTCGPADAQVAPPEAAAETPRGLPDRLGPMELTFPDGSRLGLGFATQLRGSVVNEGGSLGEPGRKTEETLEIRRLRLLLRGAFLDDRLKVLVQFSFAPGSPELVDVWAEYALTSAVCVRVGQTKVPFTRHRAQSYTQLALADWDPAAVRFGAERQIGAMVHDGQRGDGHLNYALGVFSGVNARSAFARGIAEAYGEPLTSRSSFRNAPAPTELHPEVVGILGYSTSKMDNTAPTDPEGGGPRLFAGISGAYDANPVDAVDFAARVAPELLLKLYHVSLNLVAYGGMFDALDGPLQLGMLGLTSELTYRFHPRFEVAGRYSRTDALDALRDDARAHAAGRLAAADPADYEASQERYALVGTTRAEEEIALGFNAYAIGRNLAWQTDVALLRTDRIGTALDAEEVRMRTQLQLAF